MGGAGIRKGRGECTNNWYSVTSCPLTVTDPPRQSSSSPDHDERGGERDALELEGDIRDKLLFPMLY